MKERWVQRELHPECRKGKDTKIKGKKRVGRKPCVLYGGQIAL